MAIQDVDSDPKSLLEAHSCCDWLRWKEAMDCEIATLEKAGTWVTVPRPAGKNIVGSKWVFCIKHKADGTIDKYKAHLVADKLRLWHGERRGVLWTDRLAGVT
jgi:hypothetical protein